MILLPVDESYAFDYLSILYVKLKNGLKVNEEINVLELSFRKQNVPVDRILASSEFKNLFVMNEKVFFLVDKACKDEIKASDVDNANQLRFMAKGALQKTFWPKMILKEKKTHRLHPPSKRLSLVMAPSSFTV